MKINYLLGAFLLIAQAISAQTTYYVDADAVDDTGDGTSPATAWKTIAKVNSESYSPGDQILFNSGDLFYGKVTINDSGVSGNPIVFGKYGGDTKPIINGRNYLACIDGSGAEYYIVRDLELVNNSDNDTGIIDTCTNGGCTNGAEQKRYGFYANSQSGERKGIVLDNLTIHNIYPSTADGAGEYNGHAIQFTAWGGSPGNYFNGVTIKNCELYDTGILGISINKWGSPAADNIHKNIKVIDNHIYRTGGSGIVYFEVNGYLIENNIIEYTGDYTLDTRQRGRGSGFWCVRTQNGLLQYNKFSNAHGPKDSCGAHIDIENDNVIIQYNLSENNAGGFAEYMGENTNCIYRYNVSINDGWRVKWDGTLNPQPTMATHPHMYTAKGERNGQVGAAVWFSNYYGPGEPDKPSIGNAVYNNTFYIGTYSLDWDPSNKVRAINAYLEFETGTADNLVENNIFYLNDGTGTTDNDPSTLSYFEEVGALVDANDLNNNIYNNAGPIDGSYPAWDGGCGCNVIKNTAASHTPGSNEQFNTDPLLVNPGGSTTDDYKINNLSPAINQGINITDNGALDYFGNYLPASLPTDVGAMETGGCSDITVYSGTWSNGFPTVNDLVIIDADYTTGVSGGSFEACQVIIKNGRTLTVSAAEYVKTDYTIMNYGTLLVDHEGSVVQVDEGAKTVNLGTIEVTKETPVTQSNGFSILGSPMNETTRTKEFKENNVVMKHNASAFNLDAEVTALDPLAEHFADEEGDNWDFVYDGEYLQQGEGYLVGPTTGSDAIGHYSLTYSEGTLNSGPVSQTLQFNTDEANSANILSNPYASAIDAHALITANASLIDAVYFWEHNTAPSSGYPGFRPKNYNMGDISLYSLTGGLDAPTGGGGAKPANQYIPSGQGFGVKAKAAGTLQFTNSMRVTGNNTGYRDSETVERLYIHVENTTYNLQSGALIGFTQNASDGFESKYDTSRLATPISIYSIVDGKELAIQGRSPFTENQIIPLGFRSMIEETQEFTLSLESLEGDGLSVATVYLKDNETNTITALNNEPYTFTVSEGNYKDRFVLVFENELLNTETLDPATVRMYPNPAATSLTITSSLTPVTGVSIVDIMGREVYTTTLNATHRVALNVEGLQPAVYLVTIKTEKGQLTQRLLKQ